MPHKDLNIEDPIKAEHDAMDEEEAVDPHHLDEAESDEAEALALSRGAGADDAPPAELAAVHDDTESALEASGDLNHPDSLDSLEGPAAPKKRKTKAKAAAQATKPVDRPAKPARPAGGTGRSARYQQILAKIDRNRIYSPEAALSLIKETAAAKFDEGVELHIRLASARGKKKESAEQFRTVVSLPNGTGKEPKVGILDEALVEQIQKKGDTEFDVLLATPDLMLKVARIAKILGPKGKMPNPKTGTVTTDPETTKRAILSGRIELRADKEGNLHQLIGRVSWPVEKLTANYQALVAALPAHRLQRATMAATMGPSLQIDLAR